MKKNWTQESKQTQPRKPNTRNSKTRKGETTSGSKLRRPDQAKKTRFQIGQQRNRAQMRSHSSATLEIANKKASRSRVLRETAGGVNQRIRVWELAEIGKK